MLASRATYAYAAVARGVSRLIFTAGACPLDEDGVIVAVGDVAAQTERVMTNLRIVLQAAEADLTDVVKSTVYVASQRREDLLAAWGVVRRHFGDHDAPSTLLGVAVLGYQHQLVQCLAIDFTVSYAVRYESSSGAVGDIRWATRSPGNFG
jgi:enamine deaminase RidA (YjgF/YER057c/UK114 family)